MHTVQARANRAIEIDSNLGLLHKLISLRDNLSVFQPSHATLHKAETETLFIFVMTQYILLVLYSTHAYLLSLMLCTDLFCNVYLHS
jgi:hypothetical protein